MFLLVLTVLATGIRLANLGRASLWLDEAWLALAVDSPNLSDVVFRGPVDMPNSTPCLFSMASHGMIRALGNDEFTLRLLPALFSAASVIAIYHFARALRLDIVASLLAAILLAFNPQAIYFAKEFKQYSSDALWMMLIPIICSAYQRNPTRLRLITLMLAGIAGLGFSHTAVVAGTSALIVLTVETSLRWHSGVRTDRRSLLPMVPGVVALVWGVGFYAVYRLVLRHQASPALVDFWSAYFPSPATPSAIARHFVEQFTEFFTWIFNGWHSLAMVLYFIGMVAAVRKAGVRASAYIISPWFITLGMSVARLYPFGAVRVDMHLMPLLIVPVALGISTLVCQVGRRLSSRMDGYARMGVPVAVMLVLAVLAVAREIDTPKSKEELRPLMAFYNQRVESADQTILLDNLTRYAFQYYMRGRPRPFTVYSGALDPTAAVAFIERSSRPGQRVWLPNTRHYLQPIDPVYEAIGHRWPQAKMMTANGAELTVIDMPGKPQ